MTREEAKKFLPIIQAFAEGKTIQCRTKNRPWFNLLGNKLGMCRLFEYRIKPEPKYRPFRNMEECWQEMQKHQPFGWVKSTLSDKFYTIKSISDEINYNKTLVSFNEAFNWCKFADGTPFGIKEF